MHQRQNIASLAAILAGIATLGALGYEWLVRRPQPRREGAITLAPLHGRVEVIRDRWNIPHLYAEDEDDLFVAQGYIHAQERLWQMDFARRLVAGRVSEVAGEATIEADRWARLLGLRRSAEAAWPHTDPIARDIAIRYAAGVNALIDELGVSTHWPLEFRLLRYRPERWTPVDTISVLRLMALGLSVNFEAELVRDGLVALLGPGRAAELLPSYPLESPLVAAPGPAGLRSLVPGGQGSNSWVLAGGRTMSGAPLLANDPHFLLSLPSIWYENHLAGPETRVTGASLPGVPGVIIGHNADIAWGLTAGYSDTQDLYVEERHPDDPLLFQWGDQWLRAEVHEERIMVRGRSAPVRQRVVITRHGPLVSDLLDGEKRDLALRWTIYEPDNTLGAFLALNHAGDWEQFRATLADLGAPVLNFSYADQSGNIGWLHAGRIPIRQSAAPSPLRGDGPSNGRSEEGDTRAVASLLPAPGLLPADGASGLEEWLGYISVDELPQAYNPAAGYIVHANNRPVAADYEHWLGLDFLPGFRARRISELIEARAAHDIESTAAIQQDQLSIPGRTIARALAAIPTAALDPALRPWPRRMSAWDGRTNPASVEASIAFLVLLRLRHWLLSDTLGEMAAGAAGERKRHVLSGLPPLAWSSLAWTLERLEEPDSAWWQRGRPAGSATPREEALREALSLAVDELSHRCGADPDQWQWGRVAAVTLAHPLHDQLGLLAPFVSRGPFRLGGDPFTVWPNLRPIMGRDRPPASVSSGYRFIADLSDWDQCMTSLAGGQSGLPGSDHYADGLREWLAGRYHPLRWTRRAVEVDAQARLTLLPPRAGN